MLKLKYLFDNRDLAKMLLDNWDYDPSSIGMFDYFRISANAVYPFQHKGKTRFLRFSPTSEKDSNNLIGELEFIRYLRAVGYRALNTVPSKNGREWERADTPWGSYFAVVFERVSGDQLGSLDYTEALCRKQGSCLGKLHKLSSEYKPDKALRRSYEDVLDWIEKGLEAYDNEVLAKQETVLLRDYFSGVARNEQNYGLIHYDYEWDNIFYDSQTDELSVIDFDDAMYHWYAMDIQKALDNIADEAANMDISALREAFLEGYGEEFEVPNELISQSHLFRRFANLYGYARILFCSTEVWNNEPEWLLGLRVKLKTAMVNRSELFGRPI